MSATLAVQRTTICEERSGTQRGSRGTRACAARTERRLGSSTRGREPVARRVSAAERRGQRGRLFGGRLELHLHREFHKWIIARSSMEATRAWLPSRPKGRGFRPGDQMNVSKKV